MGSISYDHFKMTKRVLKIEKIAKKTKFSNKRSTVVYLYIVTIYEKYFYLNNSVNKNRCKRLREKSS